MDAKMPECCEPAFLLHRPPRELGLSDIREDRRERARKTAFFCGNFSQVKESLFAWKYASACILHKDDDLRIVHVKESPPALPSVYARPTPVLSSRDLSSAEVRDWLPKTIEREAFLGSQIVSVVAEGGQSIGEAICKYLEDHKIDLAVLGRRDIGAAEELLLGSTSKSVANYAPCPVFTVRRPFYHFSDYSAELQPDHFVTKITRPRSVVIALDGHEELSSRVVTWALANCILCDDCIHIVSVVTHTGQRAARRKFLFEKTEAIATVLNKHKSGAGTSQIDTSVVVGNPGPTIVAALKSAQPKVDLLICGSKGRGLLGRTLLGSVSSFLSEKAPCPVCIIRQ